jgi:3-hydroxy-9,10-secoandrosta-1,3,5(10)-triene-9,17-dione monooxygenase reductase component
MSAIETSALDVFRDGFRRTCSFAPSGVAIVAGIETPSALFGFTVSTLCAVSFEPALISICVATQSAGLQRLRRSVRFSIGILRDDHAQLARRFGGSAPEGFSDFARLDTESGLPMVRGAVAHLVCEIANVIEAGDHSIVIASVRRLTVRGGRPLVYWRRMFFGLQIDYPFLASGMALEEFVRNWERGGLAKPAWTHSAHVAVTAYYAFGRNADEVFAVMKPGIRSFNTCVGVVNGPDSGYHETLTRFWSQVIAEFTEKRGFASRFEAVRDAVMAFGEDRDLHRLYYSFDVVSDRRARREWIPPDREPLAEWRGYGCENSDSHFATMAGSSTPENPKPFQR